MANQRHSLPAEITLPSSGKFARISRVTWGQKMQAWAMAQQYRKEHAEEAEWASGEGYLMAAALVSIFVTFDGEKKTMQEVMDLDPMDGEVLVTFLAPFLSKPVSQ